MWVGGKGLAMSDGVKVSVWYSEDGISFHRGNGARKNPEKTISWVEAAERIESLYQNGQFTTKELQEKAFDTIRTRIAEYVFSFTETAGWNHDGVQFILKLLRRLLGS